MMELDAYRKIQQITSKQKATLVAVSKRQAVEKLEALYHIGHRDFGENRVGEFVDKKAGLPDDIHWHFIGHLQTKKVKDIVGHCHLIHSVDRLKLARKLNERSRDKHIVSSILLQIKIGQEESKYGYAFETLADELHTGQYEDLRNLSIHGVMGMATYTEDMNQIRSEFKLLKDYFTQLKKKYFIDQPQFQEISMGMSGDYQIALEEGATIVRIGSKIFGSRVH